MAVKKITSPKNYLLATVFHVESFTFRENYVYDKRQTPDTMSRLNLTISQLTKARTAERGGLEGEALSLPFFKMGTKKLFYLDLF